MEIDEGEEIRLATIAASAYARSPGDSRFRAMRPVVRAIMAAVFQHPTTDDALHTEVRKVVEEMGPWRAAADPTIGPWHDRLFLALEANPQAIEMVPDASFPIYVIHKGYGGDAFVTREAAWNDRAKYAGEARLEIVNMRLHGPACQLHDECRADGRMGLLCWAGQQNSTKRRDEAEDPLAPSSSDASNAQCTCLSNIYAFKNMIHLVGCPLAPPCRCPPGSWFPRDKLPGIALHNGPHHQTHCPMYQHEWDERGWAPK